jgi:hypothetical protein
MGGRPPLALKNVAKRFERTTGEISHERPTVRPNIDLAAYARESESLLRSVLPAMARDDFKSHTRIRNQDLVSPSSIATLIVGADDLAWFDLSAEGSALVKLVDGKSSLEALAAAAEIPLFDGLREICELIRQGIVRIEPAKPESP